MSFQFPPFYDISLLSLFILWIYKFSHVFTHYLLSIIFCNVFHMMSFFKEEVFSLIFYSTALYLTTQMSAFVAISFFFHLAWLFSSLWISLGYEFYIN